MIFPAPRLIHSGSTIYDRIIGDPLWVAEPKLNGWRVSCVDGLVCSRAGKELARITSPPGVFDGEWWQDTFWAFDVLGQGISDLPLGRRRMLLMESGLNILPQITGEDKARALELALSAGHEGVVFKKITDKYPTGSLASWLKCKE